LVVAEDLGLVALHELLRFGRELAGEVEVVFEDVDEAVDQREDLGLVVELGDARVRRFCGPSR
jgi:hypothetical protein